MPVPVTRSVGLERLSTVWKTVGLAHLLHEQRNVLEDVSVVETEAAAEHVLALTGEVIGETDARAEVLVVVVRHAC